MQTVKKTQLKFKGDANITKKRSKKQKKQEAKLWKPMDPSTLKGPTLLVNGTKLLVFAKKITTLDIEFEEFEPADGKQVFMVTNVQSGRFTIKNCFDLYLSVDVLGKVSCDKEACGLEETFMIHALHDGYGIKSKAGYLYYKDELRGDGDGGKECVFHFKGRDEEGKKTEFVSSVDVEAEDLDKYWTFGKKVC